MLSKRNSIIASVLLILSSILIMTITNFRFDEGISGLFAGLLLGAGILFLSQSISKIKKQ